MKDIYFLSGLPRSGNTLLGALLNQNPAVYVSPLSPLLENLTLIENNLNLSEANLATDFEENTNFALKDFVQGFYKNKQQPVIIDRNKVWGTKDSIFRATKYITETPKVIFTVRDIPSILASFLTLVGESEDSYLDKSLKQFGVKPYGRQVPQDLWCDLLMNGQVGASLTTLTELMQIQIPFCLVEYDELVKDPQRELNDIYDFLGLERFTHNVSNVEKVEHETLERAGLPEKLHDVRKQVSSTALDPRLVLTQHTLDKYSGLEFWRKGSKIKINKKNF